MHSIDKLLKGDMDEKTISKALEEWENEVQADETLSTLDRRLAAIEHRFKEKELSIK